MRPTLRPGDSLTHAFTVTDAKTVPNLHPIKVAVTATCLSSRGGVSAGASAPRGWSIRAAAGGAGPGAAKLGAANRDPCGGAGAVGGAGGLGPFKG